MSKGAFAGAVILLVGFALPAAAQNIPRLNAERTCRGAEKLDPGDRQTFDECMRDENRARDMAKPLWQRVRASDRTLCADLAGMGTAQSYVELLTCLQMYDPSPPAGDVGPPVPK